MTEHFCGRSNNSSTYIFFISLSCSCFQQIRETTMVSHIICWHVHGLRDENDNAAADARHNDYKTIHENRLRHNPQFVLLGLLLEPDFWRISEWQIRRSADNLRVKYLVVNHHNRDAKHLRLIVAFPDLFVTFRGVHSNHQRRAARRLLPSDDQCHQPKFEWIWTRKFLLVVNDGLGFRNTDYGTSRNFPSRLLRMELGISCDWLRGAFVDASFKILHNIIGEK